MASTLPEGMREPWARASLTLSGRLRHYRLQRDLTREDLGHLVRRSASTVSRWESGEVVPPLPMLEKVATALRTPLAQLLPPDRRPPLVQVDDAGHDEDQDEGLQCSLLETT